MNKPSEIGARNMFLVSLSVFFFVSAFKVACFVPEFTFHVDYRYPDPLPYSTYSYSAATPSSADAEKPEKLQDTPNEGELRMPPGHENVQHVDNVGFDPTKPPPGYVVPKQPTVVVPKK